MIDPKEFQLPDDFAQMTPMMQQYWQLKAQVPHMLLLFRLGDFYEVFFEDAKKTAQLLNLTLTQKGFSKDKPIPMAGIPFHCLDQYLPKLIHADESVAICEQTQSPSPNQKGLLPREIVRIITPGTLSEDTLLPTKQDKPLLCLHIQKNTVGLCSLNLSNGLCLLSECHPEHLDEQLVRIAPAEIILSTHHTIHPPIHCAITPIHDWYFDLKKAKQDLCQYYGVQQLDGFGIEHLNSALQAAGALLTYLKQTQKNLPTHLQPPKVETPEQYLILDPITCRNLELSESSHPHQQTLFHRLDHCKTGMGSRLLRHWIHRPLRLNEPIEFRQNAIEQLVNQPHLLENLKEALQGLPDLERISSRIGLRTVRPRDLVALKNALKRLPELKNLLSSSHSKSLVYLDQHIKDHRELTDFLQKSILEEPSMLIRDGQVIAPGFDTTLDELQNLMKLNTDFLIQLEEKEKKATGISTLKVEYNRVHGFFIEVSQAACSKVPEHYQRKQTLKNSERYITPELKEWEHKVLNAKEQALLREKELYEQVITFCETSVDSLIQTAHSLAQLDVFYALSFHAKQHQWTCPQLSHNTQILIHLGRHPVVEPIIEQFTPNDCELNTQNRTMIITGPNMGGKSTYMRQVALITLLARMGSFVPAQSATIGDIDRIFTRIGAADDLASGQSTFMMEMIQAAQILQYATPKSLVLMDEIGRGTSTTDGLSLAWAIAEYLHTQNKSLNLFATHYFEMTQIAEHLPHIQNQHVSAVHTSKGIVFLHQLQQGPANQSYGIDVAKLAGLPHSVIHKARQKLIDISQTNPHLQLGLFTPPIPQEEITLQVPNPDSIKTERGLHLLKTLQTLDPDQMTPREALDCLYQLKKESQHEDVS